MANAVRPVLESVTDDDEHPFAALGRFGAAQSGQFDLSRQIILGHGFERAQEIPA